MVNLFQTQILQIQFWKYFDSIILCSVGSDYYRIKIGCSGSLSTLKLLHRFFTKIVLSFYYWFRGFLTCWEYFNNTACNFIKGNQGKDLGYWIYPISVEFPVWQYILKIGKLGKFIVVNQYKIVSEVVFPGISWLHWCSTNVLP